MNATIVRMALIVSGVAWLIVTWRLLRRHGWTALAANPLWSALAVIVPVVAMVGATWMLRALRAEVAPWYAAPARYLAMLVSVALFTGWYVRRFSAFAADRWQPSRTPIAIWCVTLPVWMALAWLVEKTAPAASYLFALPLLCAGLSLLVVHRWMLLTRVASLIVLAVSAVLWIGKVQMLLGFMPPLFGWLPIASPVWLYPALLIVAGLMLAPPWTAAVAGLLPRLARSKSIGFVWFISASVTAALAFMAPAYTTNRPLRAFARYVQDDLRREAWWEIGASERNPGVSRGEPAGSDWQPIAAALPATVPLSALRTPFRFRTAATPLVTSPPADVRSTLSRTADGHAVLEIAIVPHDAVSVEIVLPPGVRPASTNLEGAIRGDRWRAIYVAPPPSGLSARLVFDAAAIDALRDSAVVLTMPGLPGGHGRLKLPVWLPQERTTWSARTVVIVPAVPRRPM